VWDETALAHSLHVAARVNASSARSHQSCLTEAEVFRQVAEYWTGIDILVIVALLQADSGLLSPLNDTALHQERT
jgi:hypothetical protein